jgi:mannitol-1-/sugar-/sorbitol-6-phosphatase
VLLRCEAFLFDLDGVLVDSRAVVERTWRRWAQRYHLDAERIIQVAHGRRTRETLEEIVPHLDLDAEVAWLDDTELADVDGLCAIEGAVALVSALPAGAWAIVTSCGPELAKKRLVAAGVPIPRVLVTSDDVTRGKPAPDAYRLGAARIGRTPASCIVFEDAPPGVAAGRGSGARVVALATTYPAAQLGDAVAVIPDLTRVAIRSDGTGFAVEVE